MWPQRPCACTLTSCQASGQAPVLKYLIEPSEQASGGTVCPPIQTGKLAPNIGSRGEALWPMGLHKAQNEQEPLKAHESCQPGKDTGVGVGWRCTSSQGNARAQPCRTLKGRGWELFLHRKRKLPPISWRLRATATVADSSPRSPSPSETTSEHEKTGGHSTGGRPLVKSGMTSAETPWLEVMEPKCGHVYRHPQQPAPGRAAAVLSRADGRISWRAMWACAPVAALRGGQHWWQIRKD